MIFYSCNSLKAMFTFDPQALIYPLTVASKSALQARHNAANKILKSMCEHSPVLVQQAMMVFIFGHWIASESLDWFPLFHRSVKN